MQPTGKVPMRTFAPQHQLMRKILTQATNKRAAEIAFGTVTSTASGTISKCGVLVNGSTVPQYMRFPDEYEPAVGDLVVVFLVGTDRRQRQQYLLGWKLR